ncbi:MULTISPECIES: hemolysin family protein [Trichocoleus]|uniref:Hemolysin family protein n=1 Tax=Trichocoleus desertorum GB2-A4 TaxID=2933944 RepID=A0ABV0JD59_9CYAN|nr:hemolysin family protein [Trichocoleus sp. FACHB-46]MBD1864364.1 HlyC/CorC family transporter [Trichocoleus sp. FACHB-46]
MSSFLFDFLILILLTFANGVFVLSEMAIVSVRKVRLQQMANEGNAKARTALDLASAPNQFLATVQIGITLIVILSGAVGESTLAKRIGPLFALIPALAPYREAIASGIAIVIVTYLTLIIGELVPKQLALNNPERVASSVAGPMRMLAMFAAPVVHLLSASTDMVMRLLSIRPSDEPMVTEEEIKVLLQQGTEAGTFEEVEQDMVERVFRLGDRRANGLMTPRPDIVWLDLEDSLEENRQKITEGVHSRFPVCQGGIDSVLGVLHVNDLLVRSLVGEPIDLATNLRQPLFIPESTRALSVLELFKKSSTHIAFVVDEYGVIQGLVTLNDILEAIVGDIPSVEDLEEPYAVQREDGSWLLDGMLSVDEFKDILEINKIPGEEKGNYHTLGGFVVMHLGHIPTAADHFDWQGLRFEVMDMDGNRVDKVLVMPVASEEGTSSSDEPSQPRSSN